MPRILPVMAGFRSGETAEPMSLYQVPWVSGNVAGVLNLWAPDSESARATVEAHPSRFGLPHQSVIVGTPKLLIAERRAHGRAA